MVGMRLVRALATAGLAALLVVVGPGAAAADPIAGASAKAFAVTAALNGTEVIPPTPVAETTSPAPGETDTTLISVPASPIAVSGTLIARSAVHTESDLPSVLEQSVQPVAGPYNARAIGQIESLSVLINEQIPEGELVNADLLRGEAVAVCKGGAVSYSAESEVVNLQIAGQDGLSGPLNDLVDQITEGISASPLAGLIDIDVNVLTVTAASASVDALVLTVLSEAGDVPIAQVRLGHAEVTGATCAPAVVRCSTTADTDGDGVIDAQGPGCTDVLAGDVLPSLPLTGGVDATKVAAGLGVAALALFALRRRLT